MYKNNDLIYEAASKLDELSKISIQVDSNGPHEVLLTVHNTKFVVESRSAVRTSNQDPAFWKVRDRLILSFLVFLAFYENR